MVFGQVAEAGKVVVDSLQKTRYFQPMKKANPAGGRAVVVKETPIELCQFLKFGGLTDSGGEAKQLIAEGRVQLNGVVETRKRKKLEPGDRVTLGDQTIVVHVG